MGLNESYSQSRNQIMMMSPTPSVNRAYAMLVDQESQRTLAIFTQAGQIGNSGDGAAMFSNNRVSHQGTNGSSKGKKPQVICEVGGFKGHTRNYCYRIVGYPPNWKGRKECYPSTTPSLQVILVPMYASHADFFTTDTGTNGHAYSYWPQQIGHQMPMQQFTSQGSTPPPGSQMQSQHSRVIPQMQQVGFQQSRGDSQVMNQVRPYFTPDQYQQVVHMLNNGTADSSSVALLQQVKGIDRERQGLSSLTGKFSSTVMSHNSTSSCQDS